MRKRSTHLLGLAKGRSHDGPDEPVVPRGHSAIIIHWPTSESTRDQTNPLGARSVRARTPDSFVSGAGAGAAGALAPAIAIRLVYEPRCRQRRHGRDSLRRRIPHSSAASDRERADGRGPRREYLHVAGRPATAFVRAGWSETTSPASDPEDAVIILAATPASCVDLWLARKGNGEIFQISAT